MIGLCEHQVESLMENKWLLTGFDRLNNIIYTTAFSIFSDLASDTGYAIIDPV